MSDHVYFVLAMVFNHPFWVIGAVILIILGGIYV